MNLKPTYTNESTTYLEAEEEEQQQYHNSMTSSCTNITNHAT